MDISQRSIFANWKNSYFIAN